MFISKLCSTASAVARAPHLVMGIHDLAHSSRRNFRSHRTILICSTCPQHPSSSRCNFIALIVVVAHKAIYLYISTRTTHAHDASRRSKRHARMGRAAQVSGVARLVGVQRTVQNNGNVKSEPKYLACEQSPIRAFYF